MQRLRLLIVAAILGAIAEPASAEDFWGRMVADQPTNFIFGYGSLVDTASRDATAKKPITAIPARVSAAFGYVRCWCSRSPSGFTALGLRRPASGEMGMTINGVLYPVEGNDTRCLRR
jgi:cation transport regulator ChaC